MGGIYISCGSFEGQDKSCSAIGGVLEEILPAATENQKALLAKIQASLDGGSDHLLIEPDNAKTLLPLLRSYLWLIEARIGPGRDPYDQIEKDHLDDPMLDPTEAKYGKGLGWKYLCALDMRKAFETAGKENKTVAITRD